MNHPEIGAEVKPGDLKFGRVYVIVPVHRFQAVTLNYIGLRWHHYCFATGDLSVILGLTLTPEQTFVDDKQRVMRVHEYLGE